MINMKISNEILAPITYFAGPLTGIFFLVLIKDEFVRFHARQSIIVLGGLASLWFVLSFIPFLFFLIPFIILTYFILFLILVYKAWQGEKWLVPVVSKYYAKMTS